MEIWGWVAIGGGEEQYHTGNEWKWFNKRANIFLFHSVAALALATIP